MNNSIRQQFIKQQYLNTMGIQSWQLRSGTDHVLSQSFSANLAETINDTQPAINKPQAVLENTPTFTDESIQPIKNLQLEESLQPVKSPQPEEGLQPVKSLQPEEGLQPVKSPQPEEGLQPVKSPQPEESLQPVKSPQLEPTNSPQPIKSLQPIQQNVIESTPDDSPDHLYPSNTFNKIVLDSQLEQKINDCRKCTNRQTRLSALSGQGNPNASIFVISEAPSSQEDRSGHYMTEQTAPLFQAMLQSINEADKYFFTGIIKCYSLTDYLYSDDEINHCRPYLYTQIEQIKPSVLFVLGAKQAQILLQSKKSFNELRGKIHIITINQKQYSVVISYHPAYLLRNPLYKREALEDLILMKSLLK